MPEPAVPPTDEGTPAATRHPGGSPGQPPDIRFLAGPQPRGFELLRAFRIFLELLRGFRTLHFVGPCVTVFGSARFPVGHPYYEQARQLGGLLARDGFTVMTGGGPGIMEAANRGAKEAGGRTAGCNIELPMEQAPNRYLDTMVTFKHFYVRKVMLMKYSYAFVGMPGGFGTADELFEAATLIQTGKIHDFPLVLVGKDFWGPWLQLMQRTMLDQGTISPRDFGVFHLTDSVEEAAAMIHHAATTRFGLAYAPKMKPRWYLGEFRLGRGR
jgi:uncharacterized protein (TIGR00730 family)